MGHKITEHEHNEANRLLEVQAVDMPRQGGANHLYTIKLKDVDYVHELHFQEGAIQITGVNGITHESLIAIVLDRLRAFQGSDYKCRENALAITKLEEALMWLHKRTRDREARGVEGMHKV